MRQLVVEVRRLLDRRAMRRHERSVQQDSDTLRDGDERLRMAREGRLPGPQAGA